jgi:hypothetical protein
MAGTETATRLQGTNGATLSLFFLKMKMDLYLLNMKVDSNVA